MELYKDFWRSTYNRITNGDRSESCTNSCYIIVTYMKLIKLLTSSKNKETGIINDTSLDI